MFFNLQKRVWIQVISCVFSFYIYSITIGWNNLEYVKTKMAIRACKRMIYVRILSNYQSRIYSPVGLIQTSINHQYFECKHVFAKTANYGSKTANVFAH